MPNGIWADIYVLGNDRSVLLVNSFLNKFLPNRELTVTQWDFPEYSDNPELTINSEKEFLEYCEKHKDVTHRSYWINSVESQNPCSAHIFYLSDGKVVLGLSTNDEHQEQGLLIELKSFVNSEIGYITYECPPEECVEDFILKSQTT